MSDPDGAIPSPARPDEQAAAFALLFQHCSPEVQDRRVARARKMLFTGEIDPGGLFVLRRDNGIVGAVLGLATAGGIGMVWPPKTTETSQRNIVEDVLSRHIIGWLRQRGSAVGQCLLHPDEASLAQPLERHGFRHTTALWYLRLGTGALAPAKPSLSQFDYQSVADTDPAVFRETLRRSYHGTLDFPEITGAITIDQALAGHRGLGPLRPELWWLALHAGRPVGVLLLNELPEEAAWEVSYIGVAAEERGHGFGRELVQKAVAEAHAGGASELILSVDQRNSLAWQLYRSVGFEPFDSREVFLALWELP